MERIKEITRFVLGFGILFGLYGISSLIVNSLGLIVSPAVLGLVMLTVGLSFGIIKESWVKLSAEFMLKNMAMLFVPFIVGLVVYKELLLQNALVILLVIFLSTAATIVITGLFVEYGIKFLRLHKMRKGND